MMKRYNNLATGLLLFGPSLATEERLKSISCSFILFPPKISGLMPGGSGNLSIFTIKLVYFIFDLPWSPVFFAPCLWVKALWASIHLWIHAWFEKFDSWKNVNCPNTIGGFTLHCWNGQFPGLDRLKILVRVAWLMMTELCFQLDGSSWWIWCNNKNQHFVSQRKQGSSDE
jgi:hypothetical protein